METIFGVHVKGASPFFLPLHRTEVLSLFLQTVPHKYLQKHLYLYSLKRNLKYLFSAQMCYNGCLDKLKGETDEKAIILTD